MQRYYDLDIYVLWCINSLFKGENMQKFYEYFFTSLLESNSRTPVPL